MFICEDPGIQNVSKIQNVSGRGSEWSFWAHFSRCWTLFVSTQNSYRFLDPKYHSRAPILDHFELQKPNLFQPKIQPKPSRAKNLVPPSILLPKPCFFDSQTIQKSLKIDVKIWLNFGIDFGPLFLTFGLPNGSQTAPKSSQNAPKWINDVSRDLIF